MQHVRLREIKKEMTAGFVPLWVALSLVVILAIIVCVPRDVVPSAKEDSSASSSGSGSFLGNKNGAGEGAVALPVVQKTHVTVPKSVKAVYISSWVAGTPNLRNKIVDLIDKTELNAVVIDIKDYTGMVSFQPLSGTAAGAGAGAGQASGPTSGAAAAVIAEGCIENRIKDAGDFIQSLHEKNIYVIGRVAVFQDPCMVKKHPEWAVKTKSTGAVWKDHKGISWIDAGSKDAWNYNVQIARASHELGFDEINFDYIRYPSDGNMEDIAFPVSGDRERSEALRGFFEYIDKELRGGKAVGVSKFIPPQPASPGESSTSTAAPTAKVPSSALPRYTTASDPAFDDLAREYGLDIDPSAARLADTSLDGKKITVDWDKAPRPVISADLFGFVTTNNDDLGIGQILEKVAPYVDFIGPMVYPSHYPKNFMGFANPAAHPYDVINYTMSGGIKKMKAVGLNPLKLRPWLQDFNLGATYTADLVRAQIKATYDVGLTGWMLWDASNTYTAGGALPVSAAN